MRVPYLLRAVLVGLLALGSCEYLLRARGLFDPTEIDDPYMGFPGSGRLYRAERQGGKLVYRTSPNKRSRYRLSEFPVEKPGRELRVFCLGGSSVMSEHFWKPDASFPRMLQTYLRALSQRGVPRVVNAGGAGTGSVQNLEVVREVLDYQPDLLVLYPEGGEKNLIPPSPGGLLAVRDEASPARVAARRRLAESRTYCAARELFRRLLPEPSATGIRSAFSALVMQALAEPFSERTFTRMFELKVDRPPVLMEHVIPPDEVARANARFLANLRASADLARERGVPLVFVMPQHNLESSFYLRFHIDPSELRPGAEAAWRAAYDEGLAHKRAGRHAEALAVLESIRELYVEDHDDILGYYIAECHAALGAPADELRELTAIYERHPMIQQIRQVAAERNVPLIDPFADIVAAAGGVPGHDYFVDSYHPMPQTNRIIARSIAVALSEREILPGLRPSDAAPMQEAERMLDEVVAAGQIPVNCRIFAAIRAGKYDEAVRIGRAVPEQKFFASPVDPFYLGWALTRAGRLEEARGVYDKLSAKWGHETEGMPDLSSDAALVEHAFQGDVFAIF